MLTSVLRIFELTQRPNVQRPGFQKQVSLERGSNSQHNEWRRVSKRLVQDSEERGLAELCRGSETIREFRCRQALCSF